MKFSENWLRQWVNPQLTTRELGQQLTMAGLELDSIEPASPVLDGVIVAQIESAQPHPDAQKLQVCQVKVGGGETLQIVCGAKNARAGLVTALATEGSELPGGTKIQAANLRGIESRGMLCAASELGLDEDSEGIIELDSSLTIGASLTEALNLDDKVLDVDLTPNRSDCLSIEGVAREVAALNSLAMNVIEMPEIGYDIEEQFPITIDSPRDCPRYCGRVLRDISANTQTPLWMRECLRRSGVRSINLIVDICNYVMLELGQPMHAFDLEKLSQFIHVRRATPEEQITLLDGKNVVLDNSSLVIADADKVLALAGIMGGEQSAVTVSTKHIFLESAYFDPAMIAGKARAYGLHTESSHRFERGVDPNLPFRAIQRATQLIDMLSGAHVGPVKEIVSDKHLPQRIEIDLSVNKVSKVLGVDVTCHEATSILEDLHCHVKQSGPDQLRVLPPSFRFDLNIDVDLIEEVARLKGYHNFPLQSLPASVPKVGLQRKSEAVYVLKEGLAALGYNEAVTFSFTEAADCPLFYQGDAKALTNPISTALSHMRTSLWPGLCKAASYNLKRQHNSVKMYEIGRKYLLTPNGLAQTLVIAGVAVGDVAPRQWGSDARVMDFYDVKGDLEQLFAAKAGQQRVRFRKDEQIGLHAGKTARILLGGDDAGVIGVLHPNVLKPLGLANHEVIVFELKLEENLLDKSATRFKLWSKYPQVRRDLTFIVDETVAAQSILDEIYALGLHELQDIVIFSVYCGEGVPEGTKSVSLGLILQDFSSTLTEQQIEQTMTRIISLLSVQFKAKLRST